MLVLKDIVKHYEAGGTVLQALRGIDLELRDHEFVSILGPSGCGKTTTLNIIGGLDHPTCGELLINGISTARYTDADWDGYRNHSIGFVFQNYNLIPHQSVLANVELALTLSGVTKSERRRRAIDALRKVGLGEQLYKRPNQLSGGQMQRVAIARALVNDPEILLADEPTGALDTKTSAQIMELLKEISGNKLVIMVTHNEELANQYSTRIIRLLDGNIVSDSNPCHEYVETPNEEEYLSKRELKKKAREQRKSRGTSAMGITTALSLSMNNLLTKKTRTILTAIAGSIGIIGIAMVLSISNGTQEYITRVQEDTLTSYPLTIEATSVDMSTTLMSMMNQQNEQVKHDLNKVYSNDIMNSFLETMFSEVRENNMKEFREYIESGETNIKELSTDIKYGYSTTLNIYSSDTTDKIIQVNPSTVFSDIGMNGAANSPMGANTRVWQELIGSKELIDRQYDVIAGRMPTDKDEAVLIVDENNEVSDFVLYSLGLKDTDELTDTINALEEGGTIVTKTRSYSYDDLLELSFCLVPESDYYQKSGTKWVDKSEDEDYMKSVIADALEIKIVGILRPGEDAVSAPISGAVGYLPELMEYLVDEVNDSEIVKAQKRDDGIDIFTGQKFSTKKNAEVTYDGNLRKLGACDIETPSSISIYPKDFDAKEAIIALIDEYNEEQSAGGDDENKIEYTDYVGLLMSSVTGIINAISYILIAFVAISLLVSSIMIGIITYISVLERTKEIGILRAIGASKGDVSRVFNAETLILGFTAGAIGIGACLLLNILANRIIYHYTEIASIAKLPIIGAGVLIIISVVLTFVAGLIPARIAAKKDPVEALRTE